MTITENTETLLFVKLTKIIADMMVAGTDFFHIPKNKGIKDIPADAMAPRVMLINPSVNTLAVNALGTKWKEESAK